MLPTTITGSYPRPHWFDRSLRAIHSSPRWEIRCFREQYLDAVAAIIAEQEAAGLDIVTDGDSRFDLAVGGKSWFFYPIERLGGSAASATPRAAGSSQDLHPPGQILWEVQEAYQPASCETVDARSAGIHRALANRAAPVRPAGEVRRDLRPGAGDDAVERVLRRSTGEMVLELSDIMNAEFREHGRRRLPADPGGGAAASRPRRRRTAPTPTWSSSPRRSIGSWPGSRRRSGCTPAGAIRTSGGCIGRCRATSARCRICCSSMPT